MALRRILALQARYLREGQLRKSLRGFRALGERVAVRAGGGGRECLLCGWTGPLFLSAYYYDCFRKGVFCPSCGSLERHRTLHFLLERELGGWFFQAKRAVLDVAPIALSPRLFAFARPRYVSFDLLSPLAQVRGDLTRACFPDGAFDFVSCAHVLEHIPDEAAALREIRRVLRPGGRALLQVPWDPARPATEEYGAARPEEEGHVRRYGRDVPERFARAGFEPGFSGAALALDDATVRRYGLERDVLMLVRRP
jgi:SAM-dependent methyltransferase